MTGLDWVILVIVLLSCMQSVVRGFVREVFAIASWLAAFAVSAALYNTVSEYLTFIEDDLQRKVVAIAALFVLAMLVVGMLSAVLQRVLARSNLSFTDRMLGGIFGAVRGILICCALVALLQVLVNLGFKAFDFQYDWWQQSYFRPILQDLVAWCFDVLGRPIAGADGGATVAAGAAELATDAGGM